MSGWRGRRLFFAGLVSGVLAVSGGVVLVNRTTMADRVISTLLRPDTTGSADAIVVMGAGVIGDCVPNNNAMRRVLLGVRLWRERRAPYVIFTGGAGDGSCPVAVAMADLAREVGLPDQVIQIETTARSTRENAEHTAPLLRRVGARRVLVVTDRMHMRRAAGVFADLGFAIERGSVPIFEGHPDNVSMLTAGTRELVALAYYRMRGWVTDRTAPAPAAGEASDALSDASEEIVGSTGSVMEEMQANAAGAVMVLGASYAAGWDLPAVAGRPVIVRGVSGQQSYEMLERFERDVAAAAPRAVIIWGFINDIFRASDQVAADARIRDSYTRMVELSRKHGIEPILATEVTIGLRAGWRETAAAWLGWVLRKPSYQDRVNARVMAINGWLVDLARRERLLVLDLQSALAGAGGARRRESTLEDGSHISPAGYAALTAYAAPILEKHLAGTAPANQFR